MFHQSRSHNSVPPAASVRVRRLLYRSISSYARFLKPHSRRYAPEPSPNLLAELAKVLKATFFEANEQTRIPAIRGTAVAAVRSVRRVTREAES